MLFIKCTSKNEQVLTIATSANMQFAIAEIVQVFEEESKISCEIILGSSGKLTTQIIEGAPYDIFVSADTLYPTILIEKNLTNYTPIIYAYGRLVLWTMKDNTYPSFELMNTGEIEHIAIANPKTAPYGVASLQSIQASTDFSAIKTKIVYGESIAQVNQFVSTQAADLGLTSKSVVLSKQMKGKGKWIDVDTALYDPLPQAFILLSKEQNSNLQAEKFANFLSSSRAKDILLSYGYLIPS